MSVLVLFKVHFARRVRFFVFLVFQGWDRGPGSGLIDRIVEVRWIGFS